MTSIITVAEADLAAAWQWIQTEASDLYNSVSPLIEAPLKAFDSTVVQNLWSAGVALIQRLLTLWPNGMSLANLETAFLNTLSGLGGPLLAAASALGSALLQTFLGVIQAKAAA